MTARQRGKCRRPESAPYSAPARSSRPAQARAGTCLRLAAVAMQARGTQPNILHKVGPSRPRRPEALYTASSPPARKPPPGQIARARRPTARARERAGGAEEAAPLGGAGRRAASRLKTDPHSPAEPPPGRALRQRARFPAAAAAPSARNSTTQEPRTRSL